MSEIPVRTKKCPNCDIKIKWNEKKGTGVCPNCKRVFHISKVRFL